MVIITTLGWVLQIHAFFHPELKLDKSIAFAISFICLLYYPTAMAIFVLKLAPWMRKNYGKATTLKCWELYVSIAWQVQTIGNAQLFSKCPFLFSNYHKIILF